MLEDATPGTPVRDAERWAVDARLQEAVGAAELTLTDYEDRVSRAYAVQSRAELAALMSDLPVPAPEPAAPGGRPRPRRSITVMGGDVLTGPVVPGQDVEAYVLMGGSSLDLRRADLPSRVDVRAVALMGAVEILVPRGVVVHLTGAALMGSRDVTVDPARPRAPEVHVSAWALMGGVEVGHGDDARAVEVTADPRPVVAARPPVSRLRRGLTALAVVAGLALAGYGVAQLEGGSTFGDSVVQAEPGQDVDVGTLFGNVIVVVPDGTFVTSGGFVVFGDRTCEACAGGTAAGGSVEIDGFGLFGDITILDGTQYRQLLDEERTDRAG